MERNPATGFREFLSDEEREALRSISMDAAEERRVGLRVRDEYLAQARRRGYNVVNDEKQLAYVNALVAKLARGMRNRDRYPNLEVTLVDAPIADGQSCPGGFVIFTTALLKSPDEATVAGVVAHELAHLDRGHINEYSRRDKLAKSAFQMPANGFDSSSFSRFMAAGSVYMNPYRPEHEHEADCQAVTWLYQAGYDPTALARFFEKLHDRQNDQPDNPFFQITRSHPYTLSRRDEVLDRLRQLQRWRPRNDLGLFPENLRRLEVHGADETGPRQR